MNQQRRISQDALYNLHELAYDLPDFVWSIQTYPDLVSVCGQKEILDQLDRLLVLESPLSQLLSYDTTFKLGDFYVSCLLFRHNLFRESPVIPALFLIHERKFQSVHEKLFEVAIDKVQTINTKSCAIVTDEEKSITNTIMQFAPNATRLRCWNHIFRASRHSLHARNIKNDEIKKFIADLCMLFHQPTVEAYNTKFKDVSSNWSSPILHYYTRNIHPDVNTSIGRWILEAVGVYSPFSGITNNQSEGFNTVLKGL